MNRTMSPRDQIDVVLQTTNGRHAGQCPNYQDDCHCGRCLEQEGEGAATVQQASPQAVDAVPLGACPICREVSCHGGACLERQLEAERIREADLPRKMTWLLLATFLTALAGMYLAHKLLFIPGLIA